MMKPNKSKLREMILYLALRSEGDPAFAKTKLDKLLFYTDFSAYAQTGNPVTGHPYHKQPRGPVPEQMDAILAEMEANGELHIRRQTYHGKEQLRPIALREPDLSQFAAAEIALADSMLEEFRNHNARDVSELSHDFIGWQIAKTGETIPYETTLIDTSPVTPSEEAWLEQLVAAGR